MTIRFDCQFCGKTLKADDSKAGKKVKCPSCEGVLTIPELAFSPEPAVSEVEDLDEEITERGAKSPELATSKRTIPCPMCDEPISPRETTCPWCGEETKAKTTRRRRHRIAEPGKRLIGAIVDFLAFFLFLAPGMVLIFVALATMQDEVEPPPLFIVGGLLVGVGALAYLIVQICMLAKRSQSIGKYVVKTQILDYETDMPADFVKTFLLRWIVSRLIGGVPCVGLIYTITDVLFVFGEERRCLHDQIAGTYVVDISES